MNLFTDLPQKIKIIEAGIRKRWEALGAQRWWIENCYRLNISCISVLMCESDCNIFMVIQLFKTLASFCIRFWYCWWDSESKIALKFTILSKLFFFKKNQNYSEKDSDIFQNTLQCDFDIFLVPHMSQFYHVFYYFIWIKTIFAIILKKICRGGLFPHPTLQIYL